MVGFETNSTPVKLVVMPPQSTLPSLASGFLLSGLAAGYVLSRRPGAYRDRSLRGSKPTALRGGLFLL